MRDVFPGSLGGRTPVADPFAPAVVPTASNPVGVASTPASGSVFPASLMMGYLDDSATNTTRDYNWQPAGVLSDWYWSDNFDLADLTLGADGSITVNTAGMWSVEASADIVGDQTQWNSRIEMKADPFGTWPWGKPNLAPSPAGQSAKTLTLTAPPWHLPAGAVLSFYTVYQTTVSGGSGAASSSLSTGTPSIRITRWS